MNKVERPGTETTKIHMYNNINVMSDKQGTGSSGGT